MLNLYRHITDHWLAYLLAFILGTTFTTIGHAEEMKANYEENQEEAHKAFFLAFFEAMKKASKLTNSEPLKPYLTENPKWIVWGNEIPSVDAVLEYGSKMFQPGSVSWQVHGIWVDDDTVIARMSNEALTIRGEEYGNEYIWILTFENGKVAEVREHPNMAVIEKVFGRRESD